MSVCLGEVLFVIIKIECLEILDVVGFFRSIPVILLIYI